MIRVLIDSRLPDKGAGGVQQVLMSLSRGFKALDADTHIVRTWIVFKGTTWWKDYIPENDKVIYFNVPGSSTTFQFMNSHPRILQILKPLGSRFVKIYNIKLRILVSINFDLYHAPFQDALDLEIPTIYHPHDLQHLHFPEFFTKQQVAFREKIWKKSCQKATFVITEADHVEKDLIANWQINPEQIVRLPTPPRFLAEELAGFKKIDSEKYYFYPAAFWPHKNHENLLLAIRKLKDSGIEINLRLTGSENAQSKKIKTLIEELKIAKNIEILGRISETELLTNLVNAKGLIMPSLHESISLPIWESFLARVPVAAGKISGVESQVESRGVLFDPKDPDSIASAISSLETDEHAKQQRIDKAFQETYQVDFKTYARAITAIYKNTVNFKASTEEEEALRTLKKIFN